MSKGDAERSSQPLQERIRTSFENAPVGMALVSVEPESLGRFMWVNRTLCEIAGLPEERLLGLHVASFASHEDDAGATAGIRRLLADDESVYSTETGYARPDGSVVWVELHMSLIRDESGGPLNFLAQVVDLTERKQPRTSGRTWRRSSSPPRTRSSARTSTGLSSAGTGARSACTSTQPPRCSASPSPCW